MILHFLKLIFVSEFLLSKSDLKILNFLISVVLCLFSYILANLLVSNISKCKYNETFYDHNIQMLAVSQSFCSLQAYPV